LSRSHAAARRGVVQWLVVPVHEFREGVRYAAYALPVTDGIRLPQDLLVGLSVGFLPVTVLLLQRQMRLA
jgi:hypothetical protein